MVLILLAAVAVALIFLLLVVLALVRQVDELDRRLTLVTMAIPGKVGRTGLRPGSSEPSFEGPTLPGGSFVSSDWSGREHLVLFAHPGCLPCETLFPELVPELRTGTLPPTVVISQGLATDHPAAWQEAVGGDDLVVVLQEGTSVARRFETFVTPHLFVIDTQGRVAAQGIASTLGEANVIVKKARRRSTRRELVGERLS